MNKDKIIQYVLLSIIVIAVAVSGYLILKPGDNQTVTQGTEGMALVVDGKQVVAMTVYPSKYDPNYFKVKVGVPVRWEITSSGQPGCDSGSMIANGLLDGAVYLNPNAGQVTVKEFTPKNVGTYQFTCPMGMVRGTLEVVN